MLACLLVALLALAATVLVEVLATVVFAVTGAYVLYPVRRGLIDRGASRRVASGGATAVAFAAVLALLAPIAFVLYSRRNVLLDVLYDVPDRIPIVVGDLRYVVEVAPLLDPAREFVAGAAIAVASAAPVLALKLIVFVLLVYGLLYRPEAARDAAFGLVPTEYHDVVLALHERVRETLLAIYVLQAATAVGTGVVALVVFLALGYGSALTLAIVAGLLQFIPVVGPSVVVIALAVTDLIAGDVFRALLELVLGLVLIAFLPDAVIRPRLARVAAHMPTSLYFVGFVGGVLTVGAIGFIVGPLVVGVLVEVASLLAAEEAAERG